MTPSRFLRSFLRAVALLLLLVITWDAWKNPERSTLDASARTGVPGQFVALSRGTTHYELAGPASGRLVVLVHGFSVPYYIWDSTTVALTSAGYRVLRYDLFGRGFSDRPDVAYDGALYDSQLGELLDSLRVTEPIDLVGLSFGGFVTAHYTAGHSSRVRSLTLVDPMSETRTLPSMLRLPVIGPWIWQVAQVPGMAEGQLSDFLHPENYPTWTGQYRPQMRYEGFGRALHSTLITTSRVSFDTLYAGVGKTGIPVMLVWGKQDQTVPFPLSAVVRRNIPSVEFVAVDSAGHLPHIEQARIVNARLFAFLDAHRGQGASR
jgi:pimeloyl-ACP methyl ester carboxylesterase